MRCIRDAPRSCPRVPVGRMIRAARPDKIAAEAARFMSLARDVTTVGSATLLVAPARFLPRRRHRGGARRRRAVGRLFRGAADSQPVPPPAGRGRAELRLRADVAAHPRRTRAPRAPAGSASRCSAPCWWRSASSRSSRVVFAPAVVHVLAPGFRSAGERYVLAVDFVRLSVPYVAIAGPVAVAAAILNAEGRVGAAAFGAGRVQRACSSPRSRSSSSAGGKASFFAGAVAVGRDRARRHCAARAGRRRPDAPAGAAAPHLAARSRPRCAASSPRRSPAWSPAASRSSS